MSNQVSFHLLIILAYFINSHRDFLLEDVFRMLVTLRNQKLSVGGSTQ